MSLKDIFSWIAGDDSRDASPKSTVLPVPSMNGENTDPEPGKILSMEWSTGFGKRGDAASDAFMADARREIDRLRDEVMKNPGAFGKRQVSQSVSTFAPKIEETPSAYKLSVDLTDYAEKDVKVQARDDMLIVNAEKQSDVQSGGSTRLFKEHFVKRLERLIPFEQPIDPGTLVSTFENGVLNVTVQKKQ